MIIVKIFGGLGNQLFQFLNAYALSQRVNRELLIDTVEAKKVNQHGGILLDRLVRSDVLPRQATFVERASVLRLETFRLSKRLPPCFRHRLGGCILREESFRYKSIDVNTFDRVYLDGYWQSFKYFDIAGDFDFKKVFQPSLFSLDGAPFGMETPKKNSVSVHIRRGDFVNPNNIKIHGFVGFEYYKDALNLIQKNFDNLEYFVFSDDINWVKANIDLPKNAHIVSNGSPISDFRLMSLCQHNIIANSTFSWWAAYLNQNPYKTVICPKKWFADYTLNSQSVDLFPAGWIRI